MREVEQVMVPDLDSQSRVAWFCLRSHPKHEHIATGFLRKMENVEVFLPRIRFRRKTRQGAAWTTEALFPGYLFARFNWRASLRRVSHAPGVSSVIHFGSQWPAIQDSVMDELRELFGAQELHVIPAGTNPGDSVQIIGGAFHNLRAVVTQIMPARKRVTVLLEFLGRQSSLELPLESVINEENARASVSRR